MLYTGKVKGGGQHQKEYAKTYVRKVETARKQLVGSVTEFVKQWPSKEVTLEEQRVGREKGMRCCWDIEDGDYRPESTVGEVSVYISG